MGNLTEDNSPPVDAADRVLSESARRAGEGIELTLSSNGVAVLSYSFGSVEEANKFLVKVKEQFPTLVAGDVRVCIEGNPSF